MKRYILFHGRHLLHTQFQEKLLADLVRQAGGDAEIVFAITSANHANSRYNPVPFHYRAIGVDRFAERVLKPLGISWMLVAVPHMPPTDRFVQRILAYVRASHGDLITGDNAEVICSTPSLIPLFKEAGLHVHTAEYGEDSHTFTTPTPHDLLTKYAASIASWKSNKELVGLLSPATIALWEAYPDIPAEIERLWNETLLTESGDLTETRDYGTYTFSMSRSEVIDRKYEDIRAGIVPGIIVDEGCADGALLTRIARDFADSDLIGVEVTREYIAQALERQRRGEFGNAFVFFYQRNLAKPVFEDNSIDTTICNSTTHEIWSYGGEDEALRTYLMHKYAQLAPGGALLIRDVVGPENGEEEIFAWLNDANGATPAPKAAGDVPVRDLSTRGRFYRFAREFYNNKGVRYQEEEIDGRTYVRASRKAIADFLSKKEYVDNWASELHEDFTHWSYSRWKDELERAGFVVDETRSYTYTNHWIVENHLKGTAELYVQKGGELLPEPFPPTTVVLVARK